MRWRFWETVLEWRELPQPQREDVIGELEESARESHDFNSDEYKTRFLAADLLDCLADDRIAGINATVVEDVNNLLAEIKAMRGKNT